MVHICVLWEMCIVLWYVEEMCRNGTQHHASPNDPDSFITLLLIVLCYLARICTYKFHICLPISAHGILE